MWFALIALVQKPFTFLIFSQSNIIESIAINIIEFYLSLFFGRNIKTLNKVLDIKIISTCQFINIIK